MLNGYKWRVDCCVGFDLTVSIFTMDLNEGELSWRWSIFREQLISLWAFEGKVPGPNELDISVIEELDKSCINLKIFTQICYFLLGFINRVQRDKLIRWPIINSQGQVKFRKAVSLILRELIVKYSHLNLKSLADSYLIDPNHNQKKILDFVLGLSNAAIYEILDDPCIYSMSNLNNLNENEIEIATNLIRKVKYTEESEIEKCEFPVKEFDSTRINVVNKCVALKQENSQLNDELNMREKCFIEKGILKNGSCGSDWLGQIYKDKLHELKEINKELKAYTKLGEEIIKNVKAAEEPVQLRAVDLGLNKEPNLCNVAAEAYDKLNATFDYIKSKYVDVEQKEEYYTSLQNLKKTLLREQNVLTSFINKYSVAKSQH